MTLGWECSIARSLYCSPSVVWVRWVADRLTGTRGEVGDQNDILVQEHSRYQMELGSSGVQRLAGQTVTNVFGSDAMMPEDVRNTAAQRHVP